jgi:hypothetical protein
MATIPTVPTEVPGNFWTAALWNANVLGGLNYLFAPVRFKGYSSTAQSFTSGTTIGSLTLDSELYDSDGGHSTVTNTSRFTVQTAGLYHVTGAVTYGINSTGTRMLCVLLNGVVVVGSKVQVMPSATNGATVKTATDVQCAVGDYIELGTWQNAGTAGTTVVGTYPYSTDPGVVSTMELYRISA